MTEEEFVQLMRYPEEWVLWGMLPEEVIHVQMGEYEPGSEAASEHYRNGAFHYWLRQEPDKGVLIQLVRLSFLDPDQRMAEWLRQDNIAKAMHCDEEVLSLLRGAGG
ncbi:hypothetical protein [Hydrogenophaga sp. 5NK40-0174]|uniref:hypothetical protein n=1 Tax=Hydrogenophaga sp. 5NK40-0174 TaxID=3127649 RepID=UPI00310606D0